MVESDPRAEFVVELKRLRISAGWPSVPQLVAENPTQLKQQTVSELLGGKGKRPPRWDLIAAFVTACVRIGEAAKLKMPSEEDLIEQWRRRHADLVVVLEPASSRRRSTSPTDGADDPADVPGPGHNPERRSLGPMPPASAEADAHAARTGLPAPYSSKDFLARSHVEEPAVKALVAKPRGGRGEIVALVGMSGTGKTSSAVQIARDLRVRRRFTDGIWWLDVRRTPSALGCQLEILRVLGEPQPDSVMGIRSLLQDRLAGLSCLIVLDNLTAPDVIEAVDIIGPHGALLVTTVDHSNLPSGITAFEVGQFDPQGARELFRRYSGEPAISVNVEALLDRCGGLPLALAICGAMVADGYEVEEVTALLKSANLGMLNRWFRDYPHRSLLAALEVGIGVLANDERSAYGDLVVFAERGPVSIAAAAQLWSIDDTNTRTMIKQLSRRSLLTYRADDTFIIHDLLFQYLRAAAGDELPGLHARLAQAYLHRWGGLNAGLPDLDESDDYGVTNIAIHLDQAAQPDDLHRLLALETAVEPGRNLWFAIHDRTGGIDAYLADINLALRWAERATDSSTTTEDLATNRALEMHYLLVKATLTSIAVNVPAPLMAALVRRGVWSFATAITYARAIANPLGRARAFAALVRIPTPDEIDRSLLLTQASVAAAAVESTKERAWAFAALIPCASLQDRPALFDKTMTAADQVHRTTRAWILSRLARHVPDLVRERLLALVRSDRVLAIEFSALMQALTSIPELRSPLHAQVMRLGKAHWRLCLLITMLRDASEPERDALLADAHGAAAELAPSADANATHPDPSGLLQPLLRGRGDRNFRREAVQVLLAQLPESDRRAALDQLLRPIEASEDGDAALVRYALEYLPDDAHPSLVAQTLGNEPSLADLSELAPYLNEHLLAHAVDLVVAATASGIEPQAWDDLAPHLPPDLLRHALDLVVELDSPAQRADALVRLAPGLPEAELLAVLDIVRDVDDPDGRAVLLAVLAEHLPPAALPAVLDALPDNADPPYRAVTLVVVATRMSGAERDRVMALALAAANDVKRTLPGLYGLLDDVVDPRQIWPVMALQESLDTPTSGVGKIELAGLAHLLPRPTIDRALPIVRVMGNTCQQSHVLATMVAGSRQPLRATLLADALRAACADHHHPDGTTCHIEQRLADAAAYVPLPERLQLSDTYIAKISATVNKEPEPTDLDRPTRLLKCLEIYRSEQTAGPSTVDEPHTSPPTDWAHWRRALANAAVDRNTLRTTAVDACLAVTLQVGVVDLTGTQLAQHIMAVHRWWPGAHQTRPTNRMAEILASALGGLNMGSQRERWMSEHFQNVGEAHADNVWIADVNQSS